MRRTNQVKVPALAIGAIGVLLLAYLGYTTLIGPRVRSSEAAAARRGKTLGPKSLERLQNRALRLAEARALGEAKVKPAATILAQFTKDGDPEFRKTCVWAIGNIGDKGGVNALRVRVFDKDVGVRIETAQALGKLYGHVAFKALEDMMSDEEAAVRVAVAKTFATVVAEDKTVISRLADLLKDAATEVRVAALRGLAKSNEDEATTAMVRALADADAEVRGLAAREIAGRRSEAAYYALGMVLGNADATVRAAAGEAVLQIGKPILPYLKSAITATPSLEARIEAVRLLAKVGGPDAVPTLVGMLGKLPRDGGGRAVTELRDATVENLAAIGEPAIPAMSQEVMIGENSRLAEESVAEVCARIGKAAVPAIVQGITRWKLYHDPAELELWLRTLGRIGDPGARPALNRALSQDLDGMDKVVAEVRQQIETASGQKLPDPRPDPVAFHAPIAAVAALDFPAPPMSPTTKPCGRVPENGVLTLVLWEGMFRADAKAMCSANLEVPRKDGAWFKRLVMRAPFYNDRHHPGRLIKEATAANRVSLDLDFAIQHDVYVPGGYAEYHLELDIAADGAVTGTFAGHTNYREAKGQVTGWCREGAATNEETPVVASGEHPRLFFREGDLPTLRARARTEFGRRVIRALLDKSAAGKVEDYEGYLEWTANWVSGMERAMAHALFALLFDDPLHGERAAKGTRARMLQQAYGGEHGELHAWPLQLLGYGHDLGYRFWTPQERETARAEVAGLWAWIAPNSSVTHAGEGAYGLIAPPVLSLIREKGPLNLPVPGSALTTTTFAAPQPPPSHDGVPVNEVAADKMIARWLCATGFDDGDDDALAEGGGAAKAKIREGTQVSYKNKDFTFAKLPETAVRVTEGFGSAPECIVMPKSEKPVRTILYGLLDAKNEIGGILNFAHPMGFGGARLWLDGQEVTHNSGVILQPGRHALLVQYRGVSIRPCLVGSEFGSNRAQQMRTNVERLLWEQDRDEHARTGEMGEMRLYLRNGLEVLRRHLWQELDGVWRTGDFKGGGFVTAMNAFPRVMGVPLARDTPLPIVEFPALAVEGASDTALCYTIHAAPPELRRAWLWEFNRRHPLNKLGELKGDHLIAAFVNYPLDMEPRHPDEVCPRHAANAVKGGYFFFGGVNRANARTFVYARHNRSERPSREWAVGGFFRFVGHGQDWLADGGARDAARGGHEVQNIVEVEGRQAEGLGQTLYYTPEPDGSGVLGLDVSGVYAEEGKAPVTASRHFAVDHSGKSGVTAALAIVDRVEAAGKKTLTLYSPKNVKLEENGRQVVLSLPPEGPAGRSAPAADGPLVRGWVVSPRDAKFSLRTFATGKHADKERPAIQIECADPRAEFFVVFALRKGAMPTLAVSGEGLNATATLGGRSFRFDGSRLVLADAAR